jgi:hypothetical protein
MKTLSEIRKIFYERVMGVHNPETVDSVAHQFFVLEGERGKKIGH